MAMEPSNTYPVGLKEAEEKGYLKFLEPGEEKVIYLEIGVLDGEEAIAEFKKLIEKK